MLQVVAADANGHNFVPVYTKRSRLLRNTYLFE